MLRNYLKVALRMFVRRKVFTAISLFGVSLTLMVLTIALSMLDHSFGPRAPETRLDRTLGVYRMVLRGPHWIYQGSPGYAFLDRATRGLPGVEAVSISGKPALVVSYVEGRKIESYLRRTDAAYWRLLDFPFLEGGPFTDADEKAGAPVAVINETTRRRFFGESPALGKRLEADGQGFRVIGVVPDVSILRVAPFSDIWVPLSTAKSSAFRQEFRGPFMALLLAGSADDVPRVREAFRASVAALEIPDRQNYDTLLSGADTLFEAAARQTFGDDTGESHAGRLRAVLIGLGLLFMLLPAVNLINLNLSRILERGAEIGVRKAFGASTAELVGQFLVENLALTLAGGLLGMGLSLVGLHALNTSGLLPYAHFELNLRVFAGALGLAVFFGVLSGVMPAWRMARLHPVQALRGKLR